MNRKTSFLLALALTAACGASAQQVYKSIGPDGKTVYSDKPPADAKATVIDTPAPPPRADPSEVPAARGRPGGAAKRGAPSLAPFDAKALLQENLKYEPRAFCVAMPSSAVVTRVRKTTTKEPEGRDEGQRVDLLVKARILQPYGGQLKVSDYGWGLLDFDDEMCLVGGELALAMESFAAVPASMGRSYFGVGTARATPPKLASWVTATAGAKDLPEVQAALAGTQVAVNMDKGADNQWRIFLTPMHGKPFRIVTGSGPEPRSAMPRDMIAARWLNDYKLITFPCFWPTGEPGFPVDVEHYRDDFPDGMWERYSVAILEMLERDSKQMRVLNVTVPRLAALEQAGMVVSREIGKSRMVKLPGRAYEIAPKYLPLWVKAHPGGCLSIGKPDVTKITAIKYRGDKAKFRVRRSVVNVEPWAKNDALWKALPDLRALVEDGRLCEGEVEKPDRRHEVRGAGCE